MLHRAAIPIEECLEARNPIIKEYKPHMSVDEKKLYNALIAKIGACVKSTASIDTNQLSAYSRVSALSINLAAIRRSLILAMGELFAASDVPKKLWEPLYKAIVMAENVQLRENEGAYKAGARLSTLTNAERAKCSEGFVTHIEACRLMKRKREHEGDSALGGRPQD